MPPIPPVFLVAQDTNFRDNIGIVFPKNSTCAFSLDIIALQDKVFARFNRKGLVHVDSVGNIFPIGDLAIMGYDINPGGFAVKLVPDPINSMLIITLGSGPKFFAYIEVMQIVIPFTQ